MIHANDADASTRWREATGYVDQLQATTAGGICIAIAAIDGDTVTKHFAGTCNAESLFQIGSITKTFTATVFADAVISDRVSLDTPLAELLDQAVPSYDGKGITLVDIATHTSGLPRLPDNIDLDAEHKNDPYLHYGEDELLAFLADHRLVRSPGEQAEYSNLGMGLLGYLLSELYERPYAELVEGLVAEPLGMFDTVVVPNERHKDRVLSGHDGSFEVNRCKQGRRPDPVSKRRTYCAAHGRVELLWWTLRIETHLPRLSEFA